MNKYIVLLLFADMFAVSGFGLIDPIFALFASDHVAGGSIAAVGIAMAVFWVTKSIVQLPFSRLVDKYDDAYDIRWLLIGSLLVIAAPVMYLFAPSIEYIYLAQFINGVGSGLAYPAWLGLWSTHLDKHKESFEWSLYSTFTGIVGAAAAIVGSYVAEQYGFTYTLIGVIILASCGVIAILYLYYFHTHTQKPKRKKRRKHKRIAH